MVYGDGLENRKLLSYPVPPDMISCLLSPGENGFCIWLSLFVVGAVKQFVGKMSAKMEDR
ncbi:hypothetical protein ES703_64402 [subsurface metagenome]